MHVQELVEYIGTLDPAGSEYSSMKRRLVIFKNPTRYLALENAQIDSDELLPQSTF
jgi:hypothetical protein